MLHSRRKVGYTNIGSFLPAKRKAMAVYQQYCFYLLYWVLYSYSFLHNTNKKPVARQRVSYFTYSSGSYNASDVLL